MKTTENLRKKFLDRGYIVIPPNHVFSEKEIEELKIEFNQRIPNYSEGRIDSSIVNSHTDERFCHYYNKGDIVFHGCALQHRMRRGHGSPDRSLDNNYLYGKRAVLPERFFSKKIINDFVDNPLLLKNISQILNTKSDNLSFHNGSMAISYPGNTGESGSIHIDTPGFVNNRNELFNPDIFILNAFIFVEDINEDLAPMRIIPGSHRKYIEINNVLAKSYGKSSKQNNVPQAGQLWDEMLDTIELENPVYLTGPKGSIVFMSSTLLHAATENKSLSKSRYAMILNYSRRDHTVFRKKYHQIYPEATKNFYKIANNKKLFERTFGNQIRYYFDNEDWKILINTVKNLIKKFILLSKKIFSVGYNFIKEFFHKKIINKKYLNLGADYGWRHRDVIALSRDSNLAEVPFDLDKEDSLPFNEDYLKGIYSSHYLQNLKKSRVRHWLKESYRVLQKGGIIRITVPDIESLFDAYDSRNAFFFDYIRGTGVYVYDTWLRLNIRAFAEPVVDKYSDDELYKFFKELPRKDFFDFFENLVENIEDQKLLLPNSPKSWWSSNKLLILLKEIGFKEVKSVSPNESSSSIFVGKYFNNFLPDASLFIEAIK